MLSEDSDDRFNEYPEYKAEQSFLNLLLLVIQISERLLHGHAHAFSKDSRIESEELSIECTNYCLSIHGKILRRSFQA